MQAHEMLAFFLFAVAAAVTPRPSNLLVMAAGARAGWAGGLRCLAGVVVGMALLIGIAAFGLAGVLQAWPGLLMLVRAGGSLFLLWLAWQITNAPPMQTGNAPPPAGFGPAFAPQWVNPKSWIVGASAAATFSAAPAARVPGRCAPPRNRPRCALAFSPTLPNHRRAKFGAEP